MDPFWPLAKNGRTKKPGKNGGKTGKNGCEKNAFFQVNFGSGKNRGCGCLAGNRFGQRRHSVVFALADFGSWPCIVLHAAGVFRNLCEVLILENGFFSLLRKKPGKNGKCWEKMFGEMLKEPCSFFPFPWFFPLPISLFAANTQTPIPAQSGH